MTKPINMTTEVFKWENGRVVKVNPRDKSTPNVISDQERKEKFEREREESITYKKENNA